MSGLVCWNVRMTRIQIQIFLISYHGKLTLVLTSWKKSSKKSTYFLLLHRVGKDVSKSVSNITTSRFYLNWYSWLSYLWKWSKMPPKFVVFCRFGAQKAKISYKSIKQNVFVFKNCIFRGVDHFFSPKDTRDMTYFHAKKLRNHRILTKC